MNRQQLGVHGEDSGPDDVNGPLLLAGIRRSALLSPSALTEFSTSIENDSVSTTKTADDDAQRPIINDVKLINKHQRFSTVSRGTTRRQRTLRARLEHGRPSDDSCLAEMPSARPSSTFTDLPLQSVHIELGDYQTLLRPMRRVREEAGEEDYDEDSDTPESYGDDTLRAIAVITEKYDSFRRRQMRVRSFLAARLSHSLSRDSTSASDDGITADTACPQIETSIASTRSAAALAAVSFRRRLAADHALTISPPDDESPEVVDGGHVTPAEVERVKLFYSSLGSAVVVCASLADVSVGSVARLGGSGDRVDSVAGCCWVHLVTGVPVLVLSVGSIRRPRRELILVVADRSTGLPLWQDRINSMSSFRLLQTSAQSAVTGQTSAQSSVAGPRSSQTTATGHVTGPPRSAGGTALTMRVSGGLTKRVRFDVFSRCAALELMTSYTTLTRDPNDELWNISADPTPLHTSGVTTEDVRPRPGRHRRRCTPAEQTTSPRSQSSTRRQRRPLTLADVSRPCHPRWITRVDAADINFRSAFAHYLPVPVTLPGLVPGPVPVQAAGASTNAVLTSSDSEFRPRLPTN